MLNDPNDEIIYKHAKTTAGTKNSKWIGKIYKIKTKLHMVATKSER